MNRVSTGSDNGLSPIRHQDIIQTYAELFSFRPIGTNFSNVFFFIKIQIFSFTKLSENIDCELVVILSRGDDPVYCITALQGPSSMTRQYSNECYTSIGPITLATRFLVQPTGLHAVTTAVIDYLVRPITIQRVIHLRIIDGGWLKLRNTKYYVAGWS